MIDYDATGIQVEDKQFTKKLMPKGTYEFEIIQFASKAGKEYPCEGVTKNGDPKVDLLVQVTTPGEFEGERLFHSVAFMPKDKPGAGMAVHFLKTIGMPWEGKITIDPSQWVGQAFKGYVVEDEYQGRKSNKIKGVEPILPNLPGSDLPF